MKRSERQQRPEHAFVAVIERRGKSFQAEAAFGEERRVFVGRKDLRGAAAGDLVVIRESGRGRGRVTRRLGRADSLEAVMEGILAYWRVRRGFSRDALAEAEKVARRTATPDPGRRDLTGVPAVTIDPDEARDFDDAVSLVPGPGRGEVTLMVHIADVGYFVDPGGALDREAAAKAMSVYLPLGVEPMLPPLLANDACSLRPGAERKCFTVEMVFREPAAGGAEKGGRAPRDRAGRRRRPGKRGLEPGKVRFYRSLIRSRARLTYNQVDDYFEGGAPAPAGTGELLDRCRELSAALREGRFARGALDIHTFEPEFRLGDGGEVLGVRPAPRSQSHALIEEFMIAANEAVARYLERRRLPVVYRVHEEPDPAAVEALFELLEDLGIEVPPFSLAEGSSRRAGQAIQQLLARHGRAGGAASAGTFFHETVLRSLKQARYLEDNLGHFGLASPAYLHFTSPIRRYPDLVAHRALAAALGLSRWQADRFELAAVAERCSELERRAARVEHAGDDVVLAHLLERRLFHEGWDRVFTGEVISLIPAGLFLRFEEVFEGFVPARVLRGDYYVLNDKGSALVGRRSGRPYRLGDEMNVRVERIDKLRGKVELRPAGGRG